MELRERLRNYLLDNDRKDIEISEIRFLQDGTVVFYVEIKNET